MTLKCPNYDSFMTAPLLLYRQRVAGRHKARRNTSNTAASSGCNGPFFHENAPLILDGRQSAQVCHT
ncbi:Uncharacterised protein [Tatumella ptyseos]|uniref:Uncharacterized protein n=1 Tax=Tatumella ptyseos TaxID=82987 RepID=A0A2X5NVB9_9GAMM|nr:Uncharacterised protein [Tatumella ptyseos]